jgi:hypothetical protein
LQVLQCVYAVARQAQAIGYVGPRLGVTMYKSREEQLAIEKRRVEDAEKEARRLAQVEKDALARRLVCVAFFRFIVWRHFCELYFFFKVFPIVFCSFMAVP